jgi:hypothetical protein
LKTKILGKLENSEHVRSERVSKWFKHIGITQSWNNVTALIDDDLGRKDFGPYYSDSLKMVLNLIKNHDNIWLNTYILSGMIFLSIYRNNERVNLNSKN